jgi:hypothetical protein
MAKVQISVSKRSTAIVDESFVLVIDPKVYEEYINKHPNATPEQIAKELESERVDYDIEVDEIVMVHDACYDFV